MMTFKYLNFRTVSITLNMKLKIQVVMYMRIVILKAKT